MLLMASWHQCVQSSFILSMSIPTAIRAQQPIGIFDSGVGGLTVAAAVARHLPHESIVYFGDTAHMPYGEKSVEAIQHYSQRIADFLLALPCKCIIIACHTASAAAAAILAKHIGSRALLLDVIQPVVSAVNEAGISQVGIISTARTYKSGVYPSGLRQYNPALRVAAKPTPSLAQMIEEGLHRAPKVMAAVAEHYLSDPLFDNIEGLILACTHYPLIKTHIARYYEQRQGAAPKIFDSTDTVARALAHALAQEQLMHPNTEQLPIHRFFVSDYTAAFEQTAALFFEQNIRLQHYPIWD